MRAMMIQAGERLLIECQQPWLEALVDEACGPALRTGLDLEIATVHVTISDERAPFEVRGWEPLTRGVVHREGSVVMSNACGSGFDLRVSLCEDSLPTTLRVEARFRPPGRERLAAVVLRARFQLLARAVLLQYPALWLAGTRGFAPLHAAAVTVGDGISLLAGPGGVGRSTLLLQALSEGSHACSDNLCVSDGRLVQGLVEPVRIEGARGRRMPHGRGECELPHRVDSLAPDRLVVLRRAAGVPTTIRPLTAEEAARSLAAGTYMAGELRRFWAFAATVGLGTGYGPVHPSVAEVARIVAQLPAMEIILGDRPTPTLAQLLTAPMKVGS